VHSYYHLVPLVLSYCFVGYLSDLIDHSHYSAFLVFHRLTRKHLVILVDMVSGCITFSEAPRLARKCGTQRSDSPVRAL
jgi:hypothetical protein